MIRLFIWIILSYLIYVLFRNYKLLSRFNDSSNKYKNLNIKDADYEDIDKGEEN